MPGQGVGHPSKSRFLAGKKKYKFHAAEFLSMRAQIAALLPRKCRQEPACVLELRDPISRKSGGLIRAPDKSQPQHLAVLAPFCLYLVASPSL